MSYGKSDQGSIREAKTGGGDLWKPPDGDSRIRIMPPATEEQETFWFKTATHFNVGPDESSVPCPVESGIRESDFLCRMIRQLKKGDEDQQAEAEEMGARPRFLVSIVDYAESEAGVQVWACPVTVFRQLKKYRLNEDEYGDMTDLADGYDILLEKTGSGINTKYDAAPARKNSAFPTKELLEHRDESVADVFQALKDEKLELPDLAAVQNFPDDDRMEGIYRGVSVDRQRTEPSEGGGEDTEPEPADEGEDKSEEKDEPRQRRSARTKTSEDVADPEAKKSKSRIRDRVRDLD